MFSFANIYIAWTSTRNTIWTIWVMLVPVECSLTSVSDRAFIFNPSVYHITDPFFINSPHVCCFCRFGMITRKVLERFLRRRKIVCVIRSGSGRFRSDLLILYNICHLLLLLIPLMLMLKPQNDSGPVNLIENPTQASLSVSIFY